MSHHVVADDLEGASAVLHWLCTMPPTLGSPPAHLATSDPLHRGIGYSPAPGNPVFIAPHALKGTAQITESRASCFSFERSQSNTERFACGDVR